ncbi:MAG: signal peptidase I [Coriobacteriales bacterium]|nr:signal peptidase I [Coriobacteriales bacterium]
MSAVRCMVGSLVPEVFGLAIIGLVIASAAHSFSLVRVDGGSMRPALEVGDVVVVEKRALPSCGDIVMFKLDGDSSPTLHRAVETSTGSILTRGDANPIRDRRSVPFGRVLGRVRWVLPFGVLARRVAG